MTNFQITEWCHHFIREQVKPGSFCIDATAGNGNDTEFLCRLTGLHGRVLAFDIQKSAVDTTRKRLADKQLSSIGTVILDSHEQMAAYADPDSVDCIVFNFGYLPGGDHRIATRPDSSIRAIGTGLTLLKKGGLMSLCIYSGGDSGFEEKDAVLSYLKTLDSKQFIVILTQYYNRRNNPPIPAFIIKL